MHRCVSGGHNYETLAYRNEGFVAARRDAMTRVLEHGIGRGELARDTNIELALDLLSGPLLYRALISGGAIDGPMIGGVVGAVVRGFAPHRRK